MWSKISENLRIFFRGFKRSFAGFFFETPNPVIIKKIASKHEKSENESRNIHGLQIKREEK